MCDADVFGKAGAVAGPVLLPFVDNLMQATDGIPNWHRHRDREAFFAEGLMGCCSCQDLEGHGLSFMNKPTMGTTHNENDSILPTNTFGVVFFSLCLLLVMGTRSD